MTGSVLHVNISPGGIPKRPIPEAYVTMEGIRGDRWAKPSVHGGPNQALLLITSEGLDELTAQGFGVFPGALGENLTTVGLERRQLRIGQRFRAGDVYFELTKRRAPCVTLNVYPGIQKAIFDQLAKDHDPASPRWGLGGMYARVLEPGVIRPHDIITLVDQVV